MPLKDAVGPQLAAYRDVLPVARISPEKARKLGLPTTIDDVPSDRWEALFRTVTLGAGVLLAGWGGLVAGLCAMAVVSAVRVARQAFQTIHHHSSAAVHRCHRFSR